MEKRLSVLLFSLVSFVLLLGVASAWSVDITKLNNAPINSPAYYDVGVDTISYMLDTLDCSSDKVAVWFSKDGGTTKESIGCTVGGETTEGNFSHVEGWNNWTIYLENKTSGLEVNETISFWVDSIVPNLTYVTPNSNWIFTNGDVLNFQFWLNETNKGYYWGLPDKYFYYKITNKYDESTSNTLTDDGLGFYSENGNYDLMGGWLYEGNYSWVAKAKDVDPDGNLIRERNLSGIITRDTTNPSIIINSPLNRNYSYQINSVDFSAIDSYLDYCEFSNISVTKTIDCYSSYLTQSQEGWNNWTVRAYDKATNMNQSIVNFFVDSIAPKIWFEVLGTTDSNSYTQDHIDANVSAYDVALDTITIELYDDSNTLVSSISNNSNFSTTFSLLDDGVYTLTAIANDSFEHLNRTLENKTILLDTTAPTYSNIWNSTNNVYGNTYFFNSTWNDNLIGMDSVWIDFDGQNYSTPNSKFEISNLAAGNYTMRWWANDSLGNTNSTVQYVYEIKKATSSCYIAGDNVTYSGYANVNVSASCEPVLSYNLYREGKEVNSENNNLALLGAGTYNYVVNISETQNYTSASTSLVIEVSKGTGLVDLELNRDRLNFSGEAPQTVNITANLIEGEGNINLYIGGIFNSAGTNPLTVFENTLGNYEVVVEYPENNNWTGENKSLWIEIVDTTGPTIELFNPSNNAPFAYDENIVSFNYSVQDYMSVSTISNCSIYLDGILNDTTFTMDNFTIIGIRSGQEHNWSIECTDSSGNVNKTEVRYFTILSNMTLGLSDYSTYTDLSGEPDISSVDYFSAENENGSFIFLEPIDFSSGDDWTSQVSLNNGNFIFGNAPIDFRKSVNLTFENVSYTNPEILGETLPGAKEVLCRSDYASSFCSNYIYNSTTKQLNVTINGNYISYEVREYVAPLSPGPSGGGNSGGGTTGSACKSDEWTCVWGEDCVDGKINYTCENNCGSINETQISCIKKSSPSNNNEEVIEEIKIDEEEKKGFLSWLTGRAVEEGEKSNSKKPWKIFIFISGIIAVLFLVAEVYRKNDLKKNKK